MNRRDFVKLTAMAGAATLMPWQRAYAGYAQTQGLVKFGSGQALRMFGTDIPIAAADTARYPGVDYYNIVMGQYTDQLHPSLGPTTLYGYANANSPEFKHLGGAIVATKDRPVRITWQNNLPPTHILPADDSVITPFVTGANMFNRAAPHLHGGLVPWPSDGGPYHWFAADGERGASVVDWLPVDLAGTRNNDYWYPNNQSARMMWYHDHAIGITRLNAYAGLASGYLLKDPSVEVPLMNSLGVAAERQSPIPLVIQDKVFNTDGTLWYPNTYDLQYFMLAKGFTAAGLPSPSLVAEFWGDTMLVNGSVYPTLTVYPRKYRFQILNACNTRFMNLQLWTAAGQRFPLNTEPNYAAPGPAILQLGTEGGFLDGTAVPKGVTIPTIAGAVGMLLAPAERADIVIDFSKIKPGRYVILHNDAPVPYPGGVATADFWPGNKKLAVPPAPGYGPNTRTLLQFYVADPAGVPGGVSADAPADANWTLPFSPAPIQNGATCDVALYETFDQFGRLQQQLGPLTGALPYEATATEAPAAGTVEVWRVFNTTADTHPIHFHYFNVRIVSRQPFNAGFALTGNAVPPDPNEQGWKETVRVNPGECLTILVDVPPLPQVNVPLRDPATGATVVQTVPIPDSPRTGGHEYVWHCHILEHEEHDMMRPMIVTA